jgi:hypothetical protein
VTTFQLDENSNSKLTAAACHAGGLAEIALFPEEWRGRGVKDPEMLARFLPGANPLITGDASIVHDHPGSIPEHHAGLLIVAPPTDRIRTTTRQFIKETLDSLKRLVRGWEAVSFRNSILLLSDNFWVQLLEVQDGRPVTVGRYNLANETWREALRAELAVRSSRPSPI